MNIDTRNSNTLPTVMVATADGGIRGSLNELLRSFCVQTRWVSGVEEASEVLARQHVSACLCGFWLADGTYRELVKRRLPGFKVGNQWRVRRDLLEDWIEEKSGWRKRFDRLWGDVQKEGKRRKVTEAIVADEVHASRHTFAPCNE